MLQQDPTRPRKTTGCATKKEAGFTHALDFRVQWLIGDKENGYNHCDQLTRLCGKIPSDSMLADANKVLMTIPIATKTQMNNMVCYSYCNPGDVLLHDQEDQYTYLSWKMRGSVDLEAKIKINGKI